MNHIRFGFGLRFSKRSWAVNVLIDKNVETYKKAFFHLNSECIKNYINFLPKMLFADFKKAIHSAALIVWPSVELK